MEAAQKKTAGRSQALSAHRASASFVPGVSIVNRTRLQMASKVSSPADPEEKEADSTAQKIMRMAIPASSIRYVKRGAGGVFRQIAKPDKIATRLKSPYISRFADALNRSSDIEQIKRKTDTNEEKPEVQKKASDDKKPEVQRTAANDEESIQRQQAGVDEPEVNRKVDSDEDQIQRKANPEQEDRIQAKAEGTPNVASNVSADIRSSMSGGTPLPLSVRKFMEPRFKADFSNVRIHNDDRSAKLNQQVQAKAFAVSNHVFFGKDQFQPETDEGKELIAHELTHTIQQGGALQRREDAAAVTQRSEPKISRLGISDALDYFADRAYLIPGFRMFTIILGMNPINRSDVDRSAANILRAVVEFLPGGVLITRALDAHGIFDQVGTWIESQISSLGLTWTIIRSAIDRFLDSLSWTDIFDLGAVWNRAKRIFTEPITRIKNFVRSIYNQVITFIKDAVLRPLAEMASRTRGWDLLIAVLGFNPITGDAVPRTAETLIGGFMRLIGQEEIWENIKRANAAARAWAWFQGALEGLMGFVQQIPTMFMNAFLSLGIRDLLNVPAAFLRVARVFAGFAGRFFSWAGSTVMQLLEIIFEVVAPGVMPYIRRAAGAFTRIVRNPIGFLRNLVRAGKLGFRKFRKNFLTHLRSSLVNWLTGSLSGTGVYIPQAFNLREILKFVLSVLGLTWQNIRLKLVRVVGETTVAAMESGFSLIRTLITEGPAAAWRQLLEGLSNLKDMVIEQVISFVRNRIVMRAITTLMSMLTPAGAFIQAIITTYNTIMFFVERMRTIMRVAMSFINSMTAIAAGRIGVAANRVERTMAGMLTLVISFLARLAGLGRVSAVITNIINRIREPIDRGLDRIVAWIVQQARRLGRFVAQAGVPQDPNERLRLGMARAVAVVNRLPTNGLGERVINGALAVIKVRYAFNVLRPYKQGNKWWVRGEINPVSAMATNQSSSGQTQLTFRQNEQIKVKFTDGMWVAKITRITTNDVSYRYDDTRKGTRTNTKTEFQQMISANDVQRYSGGGASRRQRYMGGNPPRGGTFDQQVLNRYRPNSTRKYVPVTASDLASARIRFPKRASGTWYTLPECDLSHEPTDAVTFWNSLQGAEKTPRSPRVRTFMINPMKYIFEPSGLNRGRGSRDNERYTDPHVV